MWIKIHPSRLEVLKDEFEKEYMLDIKKTLVEKKEQWEVIYPPWSEIFTACNLTPFHDVKVVILWQDPYHGIWQAHWLSFSVKDGVRPPPSLKNIYKEIASDIWVDTSDRWWNLTAWATQWVLLLNSILTVTAWKPASHHWVWRQQFTDAIIGSISNEREWCVFLLRWKFAQSKSSLINQKKHLVLTSPHPSPFSAHTWFFWSKHFSQANEYLLSQWSSPINR